jgi:hypothetical protein
MRETANEALVSCAVNDIYERSLSKISCRNKVQAASTLKGSCGSVEVNVKNPNSALPAHSCPKH